MPVTLLNLIIKNLPTSKIFTLQYTYEDVLTIDNDYVFLDIDVAFTSLLKRANRTLDIILETFQNIQVITSHFLLS